MWEQAETFCKYRVTGFEQFLHLNLSVRAGLLLMISFNFDNAGEFRIIARTGIWGDCRWKAAVGQRNFHA